MLIGAATLFGVHAYHHSQDIARAQTEALADARGHQLLNQITATIRSVRTAEKAARQEKLLAAEKARKQRLASWWRHTWPFQPSGMHFFSAKAAESTEHLPEWYDDGQACSSGCVPEGAIAAWPLKPFHKPRPIISFLNDPRPASLHHGIDITARSHQQVYAIQPGRAHIIQPSGYDERVQIGSYIYWHIYIHVKEGQYVIPLKTDVGGVQPGFGHLHLSEVDAAGNYLNPIRPGHVILPGWKDTLAPVLGDLTLQPDGSADVEAYDRQSLRWGRPYITPTTNLAALAYRLRPAGKDGSQTGSSAGELQWAFRGTHNYDFSLIDDLYHDYHASREKQKCYEKHRVCHFDWDYVLAGGLAPDLPADLNYGIYELSVFAWDWAGNVGLKEYRLRYDASGWSAI